MAAPGAGSIRSRWSGLYIVSEVLFHDGVVGAVFLQLAQSSVHLFGNGLVALAHGNTNALTQLDLLADFLEAVFGQNSLLAHRIINKYGVQALAFKIQNHVICGGVTFDRYYTGHF